MKQEPLSMVGVELKGLAQHITYALSDHYKEIQGIVAAEMQALCKEEDLQRMIRDTVRHEGPRIIQQELRKWMLDDNNPFRVAVRNAIEEVSEKSS